MNTLPVIHSLWIGNELSSLELLTLHSFTQNGHEFNLWVYNLNLPVPEKVIKRNAAEIIPEKDIFFYKNASLYGHGKGSLAGFSDLFRYQLLYTYGGTWIDMDITCLQALELSADYFLRYHHSLGVVGNILKCPEHSAFMKWCYEQTLSRVNADNKRWTLPIEILNEGVRKFGLQSYIQQISNNDQWPLVSRMLRNNKKIPGHWKAIHWMNEEFRHLNIDKNKAIEGSLYEHLLKKYKVPYTTYTTEEKKGLWWKLSKLRYTLINLRARWDWLSRKAGATAD